MKTFILAIFLLLSKFVEAQDSLSKKDSENLGFLISSNFRLDKNQVKKIDAALFFIVITIKDSAFSHLEVFSKDSSAILEAIKLNLPKVLKEFKCVSAKEKTIIYPMLVINSNNYNEKYDFMKKMKDFDNESSMLSSGIIILLNVGPDVR